MAPRMAFDAHFPNAQVATSATESANTRYSNCGT
jgi:hypothetical protein